LAHFVVVGEIFIFFVMNIGLGELLIVVAINILVCGLAFGYIPQERRRAQSVVSRNGVINDAMGRFRSAWLKFYQCL